MVKQMKLSKKILTFVLALSLVIPGVTTVVNANKITLKTGDTLTLDRDGSGYIRGVWGTPTVSSFKSHFEDEDVEVRDHEGNVLSQSAKVSSDSVAVVGNDSMPIIIYGDVDRNAAINLADVSNVLKSTAMWEVDICKAAADLSLNGKCDLTDAAILLKKIAGWDVAMGDAVFPRMKFSLEGFYVVKPDDADYFESEAARLLSVALSSIYGDGTGKIVTDTEEPTKKILVGDTSRPRSADAVRDLPDFGWVYNIITNGTIVITGDDSMGTYEAAEAFLWDLFGYVDKSNRISEYNKWNGTAYETVTTSTKVNTGTCRVMEYVPDKKELILMGRNVEDFHILTFDKGSVSALLLQRNILRETGKILPIKTMADGAEGPAIRVGLRGRDGSYYDGVTSGTFVLAADDDTLVIDATNEKSTTFAVRAFTKWYLEERDRFGTDTYRLGGIDSNLLEVSKKIDTSLGDGVVYSHISYVDEHGLPVEAFLVTVEDGASRIIMGTQNYGNSIYNTKATVKQAMIDAEAMGFDVVCGVNADFFHIESDYHPNGLCVKDGVILKQNDENRPWIAVMKDGTMDCGTSGEARKKIGGMKQGFGASHVLLSDGNVFQDGRSESFGEIRHPRTAMGYDDNGTVYLLVVDGRRSKYSNGASLIDLAVMLSELGATSAVNLDGGGSSSMVVEENGVFETKNAPSDGALRKVFNAVLITE